MPLVIRARLESDEALPGFLLRLASLNKADGIDSILRAAGSRPSGWKRSVNFPPGPPNLAGLPALCGTRRKALVKAGYWRTAESLPWRNFRGSVVKLPDLALTTPRICPECLRSREVCRDLWDLRINPCCHFHQRQLLLACPQCKQTLEWRRPSITHCRCGFDLTGAETPAATAGAIQIARDLEDLVRGRGSSLVPGAELHTFIQLVRILGVPIGQPVSMRAIQREPVSVAHEWATRAWAYIEDWPQGFEAWLRSRQKEPIEGMRLDEAFAGVLQKFRDVLPVPVGECVFDAMREYLAQNWPGILAVHRFYGSDACKYMDMTTFARSLNTEPRVVRRLVRDGLVKSVVRKDGGRTRTFFEVASVPGGKEARLINQRAVADRLGLTKDNTLRLRRAGLITPIQADHRVYYLAADIDAFMERFNRLSRPASVGETLLPLDKLPTRHLCFVDYLQVVLAGAIPLFRSTEAAAGLAAFAVRRSDVFGGAMIINGRVFYTLRQAAKMLRTLPRQLTFMQKAGLLPRVRAMRGFTLEMIDTARNDFVRAWQIGDELGLGPRKARAWIDSEGVRPVIGSDTSAGITAMWRASDVERVLGRPLKRQWAKLQEGLRAA